MAKFDFHTIRGLIPLILFVADAFYSKDEELLSNGYRAAGGYLPERHTNYAATMFKVRFLAMYATLYVSGVLRITPKENFKMVASHTAFAAFFASMAAEKFVEPSVDPLNTDITSAFYHLPITVKKNIALRFLM